MTYTWSEIGSKEMTNAYLYANINKPSNLVDDALIRPELKRNLDGSFQTYGMTLNMDAVSFMRDGGGRFAYASNCSLIQNFMTDYLMPGTTLNLSLSEALAMFGGDKKFTVQQYEYNDSKADRGFRTYVYGSTSFSIDDSNNADKLRFIVTASGERRIENLRIRPVDDNFDFESDNPITAVGNALILEKDVDPSGIGRTVEIKYTDSSKNSLPIGTYTNTEYVRDRNKETAYHQTVDGLYNLLDEITNEASKLWADGTTKFIDPQGRAILYGTTTSNQLSANAHSAFAYDSYMQEYYWANLQKGIVLVAGDGNDSLSGGAYNDYLLGGTDNDTLQGGSGNDTYIFSLGDGRDTIADNSGTDTIKFSDGIGIDDLVFFTSINDLTIGVKEEGKSIWELHDLITITDWRQSSIKKFSLQGSGSGIESANGDLFFSKSGIQNGESIVYDFTDLFGQRLSGDDSDILYLSDANEYVMGQGGDDTINAFGGNDVIMGGIGNDTIYGGEGDDTYIFSLVNDSSTLYVNSTIQSKIQKKAA